MKAICLQVLGYMEDENRKYCLIPFRRHGILSEGSGVSLLTRLRTAGSSSDSSSRGSGLGVGSTGTPPGGICPPHTNGKTATKLGSH